MLVKVLLIDIVRQDVCRIFRSWDFGQLVNTFGSQRCLDPEASSLQVTDSTTTTLLANCQCSCTVRLDFKAQFTVPLETQIIRKISHSDHPTESFCQTVGFGFTGRQRDRYLRCPAALPGVLSEMYRCAACASSGKWGTCPICIRPHQDTPLKLLTSKAACQVFCL